MGDAQGGAFRSSSSSFPYFAAGGLSYLAGSALVLGGVAGGAVELVEIGLLLVGSALVVLGFVLDARAKRPGTGTP